LRNRAGSTANAEAEYRLPQVLDMTFEVTLLSPAVPLAKHIPDLGDAADPPAADDFDEDLVIRAG